MRKKLIIQSICIWILLSMCSCTKSLPHKEDSSISIDTESLDLDFLNTLSVNTISDKDNSKDKYSASLRRNMELQEEQEGGQIFLISDSQAVRYKIYAYDKWEDCWNEVSMVTSSGDTKSIALKNVDGFDCIGEVLQTDQYIASRYICDEEQKKLIYSFYHIDSNWNDITPIELPYMSNYQSELICEMKIDKSGYYHMIIADAEICDGCIYETDKWHYVILSPTGEFVWEYQNDDYWIPRLRSLQDGSVAYLLIPAEDVDGIERNECRYYNLAQCEEETLFQYEEDIRTQYLYYTLFDEDTLLYVNTDGIYLKKKDAEMPESIYLWINHGLHVSWVYNVQIKEDGTFSLICQSGSDILYMEMVPTVEDVEIRKITLAVTPEMKPIYSKAVSEFNKIFPSCYLEIKDDYDETALLTELISGKGPVLIDTRVTGFEDQKKLWLPLDSVLTYIGVNDDLVDAAKEIGKIDGNIYGVVTDFSLKTVVIDNQEISNWNYDTFLEEVHKQNNMQSIMNSLENDDRWNFFASFLFHNEEDHYFWDKKKGANFDSPEFYDILDLMDQYCINSEPVMPGDLLPEGKAFCNELDITQPEQMGLYRKVYGDNINYIGYPTVDGASHYIVSRPPLTIRRNASKEELELALAFIKILLSEKSQQEMLSDPNFSLSVRKDVLEQQVNSVNADTVVLARGLGQGKLGANWDRQVDGDKFYEILNQAKVRKYATNELVSVLAEEFQAYFSGEITRDMLVDHLNNRVRLYYAER